MSFYINVSVYYYNTISDEVNYFIVQNQIINFEIFFLVNKFFLIKFIFLNIQNKL